MGKNVSASLNHVSFKLVMPKADWSALETISLRERAPDWSSF